MENIQQMATKRSGNKKIVCAMQIIPVHLINSNEDGSVSYVSDPANPVPYRTEPIEATYGEGSRWRPWHVEDQRFVTTGRML